MNSIGEIVARYVKVNCQHCGNGIEFDANQLGGFDFCVVPCPHCGKDTTLTAPNAGGESTTHNPCPASPHYVTVACEHCGSGIEFDTNQLDSNSCLATCPHCSKETTLRAPSDGQKSPSQRENGWNHTEDNGIVVEEPVSFQIKPPPFSETQNIREPSPPPLPQSDSSYTIRFADAERPSAEWIPPETEVVIAGTRVLDGMVYVGKWLPAAYGHGIEPALINPGKAISQRHADCHAHMITGWINYSSIGPEARASYLQWLGSGKSDSQADISYVFLYFYGLERRILLDARHNDPQACLEIPAIEREITRLIDIYGGNGNFGNYARSLMNYITALRLTLSDEMIQNTPAATGNQGLSLQLRVGLGLHAKKGRQLPADWALAWLQSEYMIRLRTPATRCPELFKQLFNLEYAVAFGDGLKLYANKTRLRISYRPASGSFSFQTPEIEMDVPDVSASDGDLGKLCSLAERCTEQLDAYSRLVGRYPGEADSIEALLLLPSQLWPKTLSEPLKAL